MARAQGINTNTTIILGLMISNGLVAIGGALIAQSQNFADIQMGIGSIVIGLASVILAKCYLVKETSLEVGLSSIRCNYIPYHNCISS